MKTVYIYLFYGTSTQEHVDFMDGMFCCLEKAGELTDTHGNNRDDLNALELKTKATPWAVKFLEYMAGVCDMFSITYQPIASD